MTAPDLSAPLVENPGGPTGTTDVIHWAKLEQAGPLDAAERDALVLVVDAVNEKVRRWCDLPVGADGDVYATASQRLGATMLAARLFDRRDTPGGIVQVLETGTAYVRTSDPDVAMLLGIGRSQKPAVG